MQLKAKKIKNKHSHRNKYKRIKDINTKMNKKKTVRKASSKKKVTKKTHKKKWTKQNTNNIIRDIKKLKIQGATNIAKTALKVLHNEYLLNKDPAHINEILNRLQRTRPTEPMMRNSLKYYLHLVKKKNENPAEAYKKIKNYYDYSERKVAYFGSQLIKDGKTYFTHCHSSKVMSIFKKARESKLFRVFNTETRPLFQGRITAKELGNAGIPVVHFPDSGARVALKECEAMFIGCDAITNDAEAYNKIGSEMFAEIARSQRKKVYICTSSWKLDPYTFFGFDEEIEKRYEKEIWKNPPRGVIIVNYAFEKIKSTKITGIISEFGILTPKQFVKIAKKRNKWMFE